MPGIGGAETALPARDVRQDAGAALRRPGAKHPGWTWASRTARGNYLSFVVRSAVANRNRVAPTARLRPAAPGRVSRAGAAGRAGRAPSLGRELVHGRLRVRPAGL